MKKILILISLLGTSFWGYAQSNTELALATPKTSESHHESASHKIQWKSMKDALVESKKTRKKILIDFFTDWCGWCKRMDKTTYESAKVIETLNKYFIPVKFNAEREEPLKYLGKDFDMKARGIRSTHEFAIHILKGKLGYPTTSFLGSDHNLLSNVPGYIQADEMVLILRYFGEDQHLKMDYPSFKKKETSQN